MNELVWVVVSSSDWKTTDQSKTEEIIRSFGDLEPGWDYGTGVPSPQRIVFQALAIVSAFTSNGVLVTDAFPGTDGEIVVSGYLDDNYLEFVVTLNDGIEYCRESNDVEVDEATNLTHRDAYKKIKEFMESRCHLLGSFTQEGMTGIENAFKAQPSNPPQTMDYLFSNRSVVNTEAEQFVTTLESSTPGFMGTQYSS
ncbi:MAG: hypothetical protein N0E59_08885 [Candidatus Thiodiazotropha taylori]|nr:hypothetical protein [Candidatus Thiodiazotropha taylori]MCG8096103.1 hypothetical protein [Candidatus Thiodiazotropha endolucinida]MCG8106637.1 hypothetical protein [Candidatus Thiodiazotropha taylori]MCG8110865.1 hypothetical protein [Candidatus Thiodiazotropha taylori]MCW4278974.1 hypothetical protein [Candidatus Thiodiazotropha taylori]